MTNLDINRNYIQVSRTPQVNKPQPQTTNAIGQGQAVDFKTLFEKQLQNNNQVTFSKHAQQRVTERKIDISNQTLVKLNDAITGARQKGVKDVLVLNGDTMFIVNTTSNTVVTALKGSELKNNVFTNIDGTVII
ncbi:TIGR02530 family flagellar biosynthesis protein [Paludicola sp. MB14-C6]|uniref:TIGR02530 family flagellar biosynthesis protein n=1 Tax=Paludihabitans sp. MB14-C6 TaxID=3070656 RepID=UPI0027DB086F|nr:TIGR02530 family flagellar biosynthesis protein [Paludicola sp. MB14-C6]WMJ24244.1 TIGR02530 family flagellar biosynthesis protein [Paludicola sp. MB14-C6]